MKKSLSSYLYIALISILINIISLNIANSASRIKDIIDFEGIRENQLIGYGLIIGLNSTGDNIKNSPFTEKGLNEFLTRLGISSKGSQLKTKNVAAVMVTANLPAFARNGSKISVSVSTIGDAKSLQGGTLIAAPLLGADGNVYAVAQGPVIMEELITKKKTSNATNKSIPTKGTIVNGAIIEKEISFNLNDMKYINLSLKNPDISTAKRIMETINNNTIDNIAVALDPGTIRLTIPKVYKNDTLSLLASIEQLIIEPDQIAKISIDELSGTIVMSEEVKIDTIAVAQGNLLVTINEQIEDYDLKLGSDVGTKRKFKVSKNNTPGNGFAIIPQGANLKDLISGLNSLGVGTRDLITILRTIKSNGALHAKIEIR